MKTDNETIEIYWSPYFGGQSNEIDWSMLYDGEMLTLYDTMRKNMTHNENENRFNNVFYCPAFKNLTSNIAILKNTLHSKFKIENNTATAVSNSSIFGHIHRPPSINNRLHFKYGMGWIFFSEANVELTLSSPYLDSSDYMNSGSLVPGKFNISRWFRPVNMEFILREGVNEFELKKNEHLGYVNFNTSKHLKFTKFEMNQKLHSYANACSRANEWEKWIPLAERYARFKQSQASKLILTEIKKNIMV